MMSLGLLVVLLLAACASARNHASEQSTLLKDWALSRCVGKISQSPAATDDAYKTAAAYLEKGKAGIEVYERMDALVDAYLKRSYQGALKGDYNTLKCIDLYHGPELEALAVAAAGKR
jgi:hypothetical protein